MSEGTFVMRTTNNAQSNGRNQNILGLGQVKFHH